MQILGLLGIYFDATVVFVTNSSLLFRFAMAILWTQNSSRLKVTYKTFKRLCAQADAVARIARIFDHK